MSDEQNDVTAEEREAVLEEFRPCNERCDHCPSSCSGRRPARRELAAEVVRLRRQVAAMQAAVTKVREVMDQQVMQGEEYSWKRESFFGPTVQCTVTSRRGDLCDMRQAVENVLPRATP